MAGRSIMPSARRIAVGILAATLVLAFCPLQAFAAAGDTVVHKKSGMDMSYTIVRDACWPGCRRELRASSRFPPPSW